jgi:hypothetical protein
MDNNNSCEKCHGTGRIRGDDGSIQTCWDCLLAGKLDTHSKKLPEHNIKL